MKSKKVLKPKIINSSVTYHLSSDPKPLSSVTNHLSSDPKHLGNVTNHLGSVLKFYQFSFSAL